MRARELPTEGLSGAEEEGSVDLIRGPVLSHLSRGVRGGVGGADADVCGLLPREAQRGDDGPNANGLGQVLEYGHQGDDGDAEEIGLGDAPSEAQ